MPLFNTATRYGAVAIIIHWLIALAIIALFAIGWYMVDLTYYDDLYNTLPNIHMSVGMLLAFVMLFKLAMKPIEHAPDPALGVRRFDAIGAKFAHYGMYGLLVIILISGYLIPTTKGVGINVFGWFEVPALVTEFDQQSEIVGWIHEYFAYAIMALAGLHTAAALKHHFINKDDTLRRILGLAPRKSQQSNQPTHESNNNE
jgi:cytochrome b561